MKVTVAIPEEHDRDDMPDLLRHIASQIEEGYREGYHPRWSLVPDDGSDGLQKRDLTARERDILCRIINDSLAAFHGLTPTVRVSPEEEELLVGIREAIDPRE